MKAIGYARIYPGQNEDLLEAQGVEIQSFCADKGLDLVRVDNDITKSLGGVGDRPPGLRETLNSLATFEAQHLVIADLHCIGRTVDDIERFIKLEWPVNGPRKLFVTNMGLDLTSPAGRMAFNLTTTVGKWEREGPIND